jgi:hypothetical protein
MTEQYDPMAAMNLADSAYDELLKDAEMDNRVGDKQALVTTVVHDNWPSGDPRIKIGFVLTDAGNAKADLTISPPPAPEVVKAEKKSWEPGKLRAIANTVSQYRQLAQHYGTSPDTIREGDTFRVKTVKTRRDEEGRGGFIRVIAFLPPNAGASASASNSAGF